MLAPQDDAVSQWQPQLLSARGNEYVLFEPVGFLLADIFADLLVELRPGLPRAIFHQLGRHARADTGNQQELLARAGVQIDLHEGAPVELARLRRRELLVQQKLISMLLICQNLPLKS